MDRIPGPDLAKQIDSDWLQLAEQHFTASSGSLPDKLNAFPSLRNRPALARFIVRYELFKKTLGVQGSVVECGVHNGAGLFTFAHLSALLEPLNHRRKIIGFDTFAGFPSISESDTGSGESHVGGYLGASKEEILQAVELFDASRPLSAIPKIHLVQGDFMETGPQFLEANQHLIVSLLYLDFDLREPTARALELFVPRMPAGSILVFDEVNVGEWPGETLGLSTC